MRRLNLKKIERCLVKDLLPLAPEKIILFGSTVSGRADEFSDLDVIMIKESKCSFVERGAEAARLLRHTLPRVDLFVYTPKEFEKMKEESHPFLNQALKRGKIIYEAAKR